MTSTNLFEEGLKSASSTHEVIKILKKEGSKGKISSNKTKKKAPSRESIKVMGKTAT